MTSALHESVDSLMKMSRGHKLPSFVVSCFEGISFLWPISNLIMKNLIIKSTTTSRVLRHKDLVMIAGQSGLRFNSVYGLRQDLEVQTSSIRKDKKLPTRVKRKNDFFIDDDSLNCNRF